jgi:hypothetical protein
MRRMSPTSGERAAGKWSENSLAVALESLRGDGFVVLEEVVDLDHLGLLRERMLEDLRQILARPDVPFNFNRGNVQQDPPPFPPFLFRDVLVNDFVVQVTRAALGPGVKNVFYSGNTALPDGTRQPVHPDSGQLWADLQQPTPAFGFVVNVPVVHVTPENGATELWPGTHLDTRYPIHDGSPRVADDVLEARRKVRPPVQPEVPLGAAVIRDIRLWHAGMPNHTSTPRPMIAMIHTCSWFAWDAPLEFGPGSEPYLDHPELRTPAVFLPGEPDYLHRNAAYDLQQQESR